MAPLFCLFFAVTSASGRPDAAMSRSEAIRILSDAARGGKPSAGPDKCGLPAVSFALRNRGTLTSQQQAALMAVMSRQELQASRAAGRFRVHYDTSASSPNTPAMLDNAFQRIPGTANQFVDSVFAILANVVRVEVDTLGYPFPPGDGGLGGGPEYDIYIQGGLGAYGFTDPDSLSADGGTSTTSISIDRDFSFVTPNANKGIPALRVTLAHEFHHAIQIGRYGYWVSDPFYYEITSTWMEDVVYHGVNDYLNYLVSPASQFRTPDVAFNSNDNIMYSRGIWGKFVAKKYGIDAMRKSWEEIRAMPPLQAVDATLRRPEYGSSFPYAFAEWSLWNHFTGSRSNPLTYYTEGAIFPVMSEEPVTFTPPTRGIAGSLQNLASIYYQVATGGDTLTLILANLNLVGAEVDNTFAPTETGYLYTLDERQVDASYQPTPAGLFYKFASQNPAVQWWTWSIVGTTVGVPPVAEGAAFPNPFIADGRKTVYIQASGLTGTLSIYSAAMDRIYSSTQYSQMYFGKRVFSWNGTTDRNTPAQTGVYIFVLTMPDRSLTGKIALLRR